MLGEAWNAVAAEARPPEDDLDLVEIWGRDTADDEVRAVLRRAEARLRAAKEWERLVELLLNQVERLAASPGEQVTQLREVGRIPRRDGGAGARVPRRADRVRPRVRRARAAGRGAAARGQGGHLERPRDRVRPRSSRDLPIRFRARATWSSSAASTPRSSTRSSRRSPSISARWRPPPWRGGRALRASARAALANLLAKQEAWTDLGFVLGDAAEAVAGDDGGGEERAPAGPVARIALRLHSARSRRSA